MKKIGKKGIVGIALGGLGLLSLGLFGLLKKDKEQTIEGELISAGDDECFEIVDNDDTDN